MTISIDKLSIGKKYWFLSVTNSINRPFLRVEIDWLDLDGGEIGIIDNETKYTLNADINDKFFKTKKEARDVAIELLKTKTKELEGGGHNDGTHSCIK